MAAGQWSAWHNIGPELLLISENGLRMSLPDAEEVKLQFARDAEGADTVGDLALPAGEAAVFPLDITWNKDARVLSESGHAERLMELARTKWRTANGGKKPRELLYFGGFAGGGSIALKDALGYNTLLPDQYDHAPVHGYHQHSGTEEAIRAFAAGLAKPETFKMLSFGDEIGIGSIDWDDPAMQEQFTEWLARNKVGRQDLGIAPGEAKLADRHANARVAWYAEKFNNEVMFAGFRRLTQLTKELIGPQVETGANFSPHGMPQYYGHYSQYIDAFKQNAMTMYWTEDYLFSVPQPPQFISWMFAMMHCATKYNGQGIHFYVMPHSPGQTPETLRRNMVYSIGAGARHIDSFLVAHMPNFTENYVSSNYTESFRVLHESIFDSAEAEPYQVNGRIRPARVAVVYSAATDHNEPRVTVLKAADPFLSRCDNAPERGAQRTTCRRDQQLLYLALKHTQHAVDLLTEDDIVDGYLKDYDVVYFAGEWIDHRLPDVLEQWVRGGGVLYACAGLGRKNEFDEPSDDMAKLLGLKDASFAENVYVIRPYLELPQVEPIGTITMDGATIPGIAIRQELNPGEAKVLGAWENGAAAVTVRELGEGKAFAVGTAAGHSYMKTGVRLIPCARGGRKSIYNPTDFDPAAAKLAHLGVDAKEVERDVVCSNNFVEAIVIDSPGGTLVTLTNWDNETLPGLTVSVKLPAAPASVRSVQQQKELEGWKFQDGRLTFNTDLEWADYIILPK